MVPVETVFACMAEFKMQEGSGKDLVEFFLSPNGLAVTRAYKGCLQFDVLTVSDDPDTIQIYEKWESKDAWGDYIRFREQSGEMDFLKTKLAASPVFTMCTLIG